MLDIDSAIRHCEEVAERYERMEDSHDDKLKEECLQCASDHRQLAEWLTDYKKLLEEVRKMKPAIEGAVNQCKMIPHEPDCRGYTDTFFCTNCQLHIHLGFISQRYGGNYCIECGAEVEDGDTE